MSHTHRIDRYEALMLDAAYQRGISDRVQRMARPRDCDYPPTYRSAYRQGWHDTTRAARTQARLLEKLNTLSVLGVVS